MTALWTLGGITECGTSWAILEGDATVKRGLSACSEVTSRDVGRDISVFVGVARSCTEDLSGLMRQDSMGDFHLS